MNAPFSSAVPAIVPIVQSVEDAAQQPHSRWNLTAVGLFASVLLYYCCLAPTTITDSDGGEFATLAVTGGIAHPSGYPLLLILQRALYRLFHPSNVINALSIESAICVSVGAGLCYLASLKLTKSPLASTFAVLACFVSKSIARAATSPEPFALNLLLCAIAIYLATTMLLSEETGRTKWHSFALGVTSGLAACNHQTYVFVAPLIFTALLRRRPGQTIKTRLCWFALGIILGLIPLVYLVFADTNIPLSWGDWSDVSHQLLHHILRMDYGTFALSNENSQGLTGALTTDLYMLWRFAAELSYLVLLGAVGSIYWAYKTTGVDREAEAISIKRMLGVCLFLSSVVFFSRFDSTRFAPDFVIRDRFIALPELIMVPLVADFLMRIEFRWKRNVYAAGLIGLLAIQIVNNFPGSIRRFETFADTHVRNIYRIAESGTIIAPDDVQYFGLLYGQAVLGLGGRTRVLSPGQWRESTWYRRKFVTWYKLPTDLTKLSFRDLVERLMDQGPVYFADNLPIEPFASRVVPSGPLQRLLPKGTPAPSIETQFASEWDLYRTKIKLPDSPDLSELNDWEKRLLATYSVNLEHLYHGLATKHPDLARKCRALELPMEEAIRQVIEEGKNP